MIRHSGTIPPVHDRPMGGPSRKTRTSPVRPTSRGKRRRRRDLRYRMYGTALIGAAALALWYRGSLAATGLETISSIMALSLGCFGLALLLGGAHVGDGWRRKGHRGGQDRLRPASLSPIDHSSDWASIDPRFLADGRLALATILVLRAQEARQAEAHGRAASGTNPPRHP